MNIQTLKQGTERALRLLRDAFDVRDLFMLSGLSGMFYGIWQVYPPAAWMVVGAVLFWLAVRR